MLQSFDEPKLTKCYAKRLEELRMEMHKADLDAFIVPHTDIHQDEYIQPADARLEWISGFSGSAGFCVITHMRAGLFVDGRYFLQAERQIDLALFDIIHWPKTRLNQWVEEFVQKGRVGFDPALHTISEILTLKKLGFCVEKNATKPLKKDSCDKIYLVETDNLIDKIWKSRPLARHQSIDDYPFAYAGCRRDEKIAQICAKINADIVLLTQPDSIAWLLNIRGNDIPHIPVAQIFALLHKTGQVEIFCDNPVDEALSCVSILSFHAKETFYARLFELTGRVQIDPKSAPYLAQTHLINTEIIFDDDPCILPKACKNSVEISGAQKAHLYDGAAMVQFLFWLDTHEATLNEIDIVKNLENFRKTNAPLLFKDISFDTIAASGAHGAIVHYRVTQVSNRTLAQNDILLLDSGGQYLGGTTDVTRTVAIGKPTNEQCVFFTYVLKGMIALSRACWRRGLCGRDLDALARQFLRNEGEDYEHGTGHGVGSYLSVHEGPQRISPLDSCVLQEGMILSNEPGYYRVGEFGIRIENLLLVQECERAKFAHDMLEFETLTLVPIDKKLILSQLLSYDEKKWLNDYHARIYNALCPLLEEKPQKWLKEATKAIEI